MNTLHSRPSRQRGITLVVVMIFLIVMSMFAVNAFNSSSSNMRIVGNMQARQEGIAAAQQAIEQTISSTLFTSNPAGVSANAVAVDIDGDGNADYAARLTPQPRCYRAKAIKTSELNPATASDIACIRSGVVQNSGLDTPDAAADAGNSLCANSEWNIRSEVTDTRTSARVAINQGVSVRVLETDAANSCM
ncbi:MAG: pilus assembly PilX N-terminal domain-containing protein [Pseudomonadota bacterium]